MAARRERGLLDPDPDVGDSIFDHHVYVLASDGDLMEGVTAEASSLAGQQLGILIAIYDQNHISIEDDTDISFSEDVPARYRAYGWDVHEVDWTAADPDGDCEGDAVVGGYVEDVDALAEAIEAAKADTARPSIIVLRTIIGWPAPTKQNTGAAHGSALGDQEVAAVKTLLGFDLDRTFEVPAEVLAHTRLAQDRGREAHQAWDTRFHTWQQEHPDRARSLHRLQAQHLPDGVERRATHLPRGRERDGYPQGLRPGADRVGAGAAGALGRVRGPGRVKQHQHGRPAVVHPHRPADQTLGRWPVRADPALRDPGTCHGFGPERDGAAVADPPLRRDLPGVLRLLASCGPAGRADEAAGHLRVNPRLHRHR